MHSQAGAGSSTSNLGAPVSSNHAVANFIFQTSHRRLFRMLLFSSPLPWTLQLHFASFLDSFATLDFSADSENKFFHTHDGNRLLLHEEKKICSESFLGDCYTETSFNPINKNKFSHRWKNLKRSTLQFLHHREFDLIIYNLHHIVSRTL